MIIENKEYNGRKTTAIIDGIQFNNIDASIGMNKSSIMTRTANVWRDTSEIWYPAINAVDINWNGANVEDDIIINTTSELLNWIKNKNNNIEDIKINGESKGNLGIIDLGNYLTEHPENGEKFLSFGSINDNVKRILIGLSIDKNGHIVYGKEISIQSLAQEVAKYITVQNNNIYMISFKDDDEIISNISGITGTSINIPKNPTKEGYEFIGWNRDINATEAEDVINQICNANITYYAIWKEKTLYYYWGTEEIDLSQLESQGISVDVPINKITNTLDLLHGNYVYFIYPKSWGKATL